MADSKPRDPNWVALLGSAQTVEDLLDVAHRYIDSMTPADLSDVPSACRPPTTFTAPEELVLYTFTVIECPDASNVDRPGLYRLAKFMSAATRRVAVLMSQPFGKDVAND